MSYLDITLDKCDFPGHVLNLFHIVAWKSIVGSPGGIKANVTQYHGFAVLS
jgi:hypothetical protein